MLRLLARIVTFYLGQGFVPRNILSSAGIGSKLKIEIGDLSSEGVVIFYVFIFHWIAAFAIVSVIL